MNEFVFDLQRFADYELEAGGSSVVMSGDDWAKSIAVTTNGETKTYYYTVTNGGRATLSANEEGVVKIYVNSGYGFDFRNEDNSYGYYMLTGGTARHGNPQHIILGEDGPALTNVWSGNSSYRTYITVTPSTDYDTATISCTGKTMQPISIAGISYQAVLNSSTNTASVTLKIQDGKTYIDVAQDNTDIIKYNNQTYTPISGTVTLAFDNDGSNAYATGLDVGDSFQIVNSYIPLDITCIMGATRLMITDGTTNKFWSQGTVDNTTLIPLSSLNLDSEDFTTADVLIDGVDYYTCLNPGLVPLLTDGTAATQYTGTSDTTTGVAIGVGNTQVVMDVPNKYSPSTIAQFLFDIAPPSSGSHVLDVFFPYAPTTFYFKVTLTSGGSLTVDAYNGSSQLDTTGAINLATYGVDLTAPIRLMLQAEFARTNSGKTFVTLNVGGYTRKQQLSTNVIFNSSNCSYRFVSESSNEIYISNIIARDETIGKLAERIVALPVSTTDTDMTENNGLYTAGAVDESILQTPDVDDLVQTYGASSVVTGILVVGNPAYLSSTGDGLTNLTCIDKTNNVITEHKTFELDTNATKAIADNWRPANTRLNNLAGMQLGWKAGASS